MMVLIVHTDDATLICANEAAQKVKDMATQVPENLR